MTPKFTFEAAISVAAIAHVGQKRKDGVTPYIVHPLRVALRMKDDLHRIVAVLHDVVEDTMVTMHDLEVMGVPTEAMLALTALTKTPGQEYDDYVAKVSANPIARKVKIADLSDNMYSNELAKDEENTPKTRLRMAAYQAFYTLLMGLEQG